MMPIARGFITLQERLINRKTFATKSLRHEGKKETTWEGRKKKENITCRTRNVEYRREKGIAEAKNTVDSDGILIILGYCTNVQITEKLVSSTRCKFWFSCRGDWTKIVGIGYFC